MNRLDVSFPMDPADLHRIPPVDADACPACAGKGIVTSWYDPFRPWLTDDGDCRDCDGTGQRRPS